MKDDGRCRVERDTGRRALRRRRRPWAARVLAPAGVLVVVGLVVVAAACGGGSGGQASPSPAASGPVVLTVKGEQGSRAFTMGQLQALPAYEGYAGIKSSTGTITPPSKYKGVPLASLADLVGGITQANGVTIVAKDGYGMTFSYRQIMEDGFTTYDPATGEEEPPDGKLTVIIAYEHDGKPIDPDDGPLKLAVAEDTPGQVVDGHWAIKWLEQVSVTKASAAWKVQLEGAVPGKLDRASYVNCASPGCHGSGWVDAQGKRWEGIPLYLVAGLVDDQQEARRRRLQREAGQEGLRDPDRDRPAARWSRSIPATSPARTASSCRPRWTAASCPTSTSPCGSSARV